MRDGPRRVILHAVAAVTALGAPVILAAAERAGSRDRGWDGVRRIGIVVQLTGSGTDAFAADRARTHVCERLRMIAAAGAALPVSCMSEADAATAAGDVAILAVQAALEGEPGGTRLLFTIRRTVQAGAEPAPILFGTPPRSVRWGTSAAADAALDDAFRDALGGVLPWLRGRG